jgi:hypothetical protein
MDYLSLLIGFGLGWTLAILIYVVNWPWLD